MIDSKKSKSVIGTVVVSIIAMFIYDLLLLPLIATLPDAFAAVYLRMVATSSQEIVALRIVVYAIAGFFSFILSDIVLLASKKVLSKKIVVIAIAIFLLIVLVFATIASTASLSIQITQNIRIVAPYLSSADTSYQILMSDFYQMRTTCDFESLRDIIQRVANDNSLRLR